ncbi:MAG TPA: phenylalanine--tRNA ligase subunit beta [Anaerolineales bacterium]|nr:phenylalanine--tRNA ligase subunit beta [Anaerolineales bacterium]
MRVPLSWLRDFVDIDLAIPELAERLTLAGLEVESVHLAGLALPAEAPRLKVTGLTWDPEKIVVGAVWEVMPHPNADRLVLCRLDDGTQEQIVLTGAPNLFAFKGQGLLAEPLKVAYAREGAELFDGHQPGWERMTLKRAKIRGVDSYSMACSEKELGISDDHEGVILLDDDAPVGRPLADYMGDAVFDIALTPNMARNASILGIAREVAALTGAALRPPSYNVAWAGPAVAGRLSLSIAEPELNPRFVLGLIEGLTIRPSPYAVQRRLRLAGMRPINNIVDATNYVMLEIGQPLHAFDFDALQRRAGGAAPRLSTRRARPGERLTTLDGVDRPLDEFTVLVCDSAGALSIAGVMGGAETEVGAETRSVLLEGAAWDITNIRRTLAAQHLASEAAYRFSRGVHPAMAERGVRRGLTLMARLGGGAIAEGLVDEYPRPPAASVVTLTAGDVERALGVRLDLDQMAGDLRRLEFDVELLDGGLRVTAPDHRLDIGVGLVGVADVIEEIARLYGYDRIPETLIADSLPAQVGHPQAEAEDEVRRTLAGMGLQEVVTYRMTSPEGDRRHLLEAPTDEAHVVLANPIASDRTVLRRHLLPSVLEIVERNARQRPRQALFELGPVFEPQTGAALPRESTRLVVVLTGPRAPRGWQPADETPMDFYDLKGVIEGLAAALHLPAPRFTPAAHPSFHPGKCAEVALGGQPAGVFGEIHPIVRRRFDFPSTAVVGVEMDMDVILSARPLQRTITPVPAYPPVLEDLAFLVDQDLPAERVEAELRLAGGELLAEVRLFDQYQGESIEPGRKSLAYGLTYQAPDRTLTDTEVRQVRERLIAHLKTSLGAKLRS